jgi:hypothetical protein
MKSDSLEKLHRYNVAAFAEATAAEASVEGGGGVYMQSAILQL